jgi:hypothetical protein
VFLFKNAAHDTWKVDQSGKSVGVNFGSDTD